MRLACRLAFTTFAFGCQVATPEDPIKDLPVEPVATAQDAKLPTAGAPKPKHRVEVVKASWPSAPPDDAAVRDMTSEARAAMETAIVPVLMPGGPLATGKQIAPELTRNAIVISKPTFLAWSSFTDDRALTVSLSSSVVVHQHAEVRPAAPTSSVRDGKPAWVLQNEGIWSVAWEEFGVWYVVELECSRPGEDARCKDDAAVRSVVESLRFVGPEAAR